MTSLFLSALAIIGLGMVLKSRGVLREESGALLSRLILNVTLPALVLTTMSRAQLPGSALALPALAVAWGAVMLVVGRLLFGAKPGRQGGVMALSLLGFNIGQFAYPLVEGAWGGEALALLVMFDIGNAVVIFGLGYTLAGIWSGRAAKVGAIGWRLLTFVPLQSYVAALVLNLTGWTLPGLVAAPLEVLGAANPALVLLLVGMYLNPALLVGRLRQVATVVAVRYGFGLAAGLGLYFWLPAPPMVRAVLLTAFVLPVGMSVIPYSLEHELDVNLAGALVNATIIISFALLWLVFSFSG